MDEELSIERKTILREKQNELVKVIEAFASLEKSEEWATLKELVFNKSLVAIERQILNESLDPSINSDKLYRLQGELAWAKKYNDVNRFTETLKTQLENIKNNLK